ncbi:MAG: hypothetical protein HYU63_08500 [Armatimonadetes bacterium]|nr:hypothetical protein [Armatimonadota bacterium]
MGFDNTVNFTPKDKTYIENRYNEIQGKSQPIGESVGFKNPIKTKADKIRNNFEEEWKNAKESFGKPAGLENEGFRNKEKTEYGKRYDQIKEAILQRLLDNIK